jgi:predicted transcriptional regulator
MDEWQETKFWQKQYSLREALQCKMKVDGFNMRKTCEEINVPYSTLSSIISGQRDAARINRENIKNISRYLKISVATYFSLAGFLTADDYKTLE